MQELDLTRASRHFVRVDCRPCTTKVVLFFKLTIIHIGYKVNHRWHLNILEPSFNFTIVLALSVYITCPYACQVAIKLAPDRKKFMDIICGTGDINADIERFCAALSPLLAENHKFLVSFTPNYSCFWCRTYSIFSSRKFYTSITMYLQASVGMDDLRASWYTSHAIIYCCYNSAYTQTGDCQHL
jgi:hypothetical protein